MAVSPEELDEIMRLYGPGQRGMRAFDTSAVPYGYGVTRRDLEDDPELDPAPPLPATIEEFREKFGRDPATDSEVERYYGPIDNLIDPSEMDEPQPPNVGGLPNEIQQMLAQRDLDVRTPPPLPVVPNPASIAPHNPRPPGGGPYNIQPGQRIGDIIEQYGPQVASGRDLDRRVPPPLPVMPFGGDAPIAPPMPYPTGRPPTGFPGPLPPGKPGERLSQAMQEYLAQGLGTNALDDLDQFV